MEFLVQTYLVRVLPPFHANLRKRLVRSPKFYWRDSGLLHALLRVHNHEQLLSQPWVGASWEGWVIEQILASLSAKGVAHEAFFLRTQQGEELDLVLKFSNSLWAIEIKLTASPTLEQVRKLNAIADQIRATHRVLISRTSHPQHQGSTLSTNIAECLSLLPKAHD